MSLSRVKVWIPGDILTAADLNAEFNNILDNPINLISPTTGVINFNLQAHTNLPITALSASSGSHDDTLAISSGVPIWKTLPHDIVFQLNPISAHFGTGAAASLSQSTDATFPIMRLAYSNAADGEHAYWYASLTSAIHQVSSATLEFFYTATSSGSTTVWTVNTRAAISGSTWDVAGASNMTSTITYDSTSGGLKKVTIPLTATSWTAPSVLQVTLKRVSSDAGDASASDSYLHTASLRIKV